MLTRAYSEHVYVIDTIEKAKAKHQQKGGELPEFTQEEIVDQMIKLAEIDLAKEAKQRKKAAKRAEKEQASGKASDHPSALAAGKENGQNPQGGGPALEAQEGFSLRKAR